MKNFIPRWLHFVPRFPQAKRILEMCHSRAAPLAIYCSLNGRDGQIQEEIANIAEIAKNRRN
jgi:hypothetical protein